MGKRIVIALGGNALGNNLPEQMIAVKKTASAIVDLIEAGNEVVIAHGNGPQVGMIQNAMSELTRSNPEKYIPCPLSVCVAMSQGYIGYDLQNALRSELVKRGIYKTVSTILTQVLVDPYDEAFYHPVKAIGRYMTKEEAQKEEAKGNYVVEESGGRYRRIVSAPRPKDIIEIDAINALVDAGQLVIACGGGGIPVMAQGNTLKGASAIIEKDYAAGKLAELTDADVLMFITADKQVDIDIDTDHPTLLGSISVAEAQEHVAQNQFGEAAMLPKIQAAIDYIGNSAVRSVLIANLEEALDGVSGLKGTLIHK